MSTGEPLMTTTDPATTQTICTPDGAFTVVADAYGRVLASGWTTAPDPLIARVHPALRPTRLVEGTTQAAEAAAAYYRGDPEAATAVPVHQHGTDLQRRGWATLRQIPVGHALTYTELAAALGNPAASRAAAATCARNAAGLFVPCHRVLRSDGRPGGFAWGTSIKQSLLEREAQMPGGTGGGRIN